MTKPAGITANFNGRSEENKVVHYLETSLGYIHLTDSKKLTHARKWTESGRDIADWCRNNGEKHPFFMCRQTVIHNVYKVPWAIDFAIWNADLWPRGLFVEVKSQSVSGSVDTKFPFLVLSLKNLRRSSGALLVGNGFSQASLDWIHDQQDESFHVWRDAAELRKYVETGKSTAVNSTRKTITSPQSGFQF